MTRSPVTNSSTDQRRGVRAFLLVTATGFAVAGLAAKAGLPTALGALALWEWVVCDATRAAGRVRSVGRWMAAVSAGALAGCSGRWSLAEMLHPAWLAPILVLAAFAAFFLRTYHGLKHTGAGWASALDQACLSLTATACALSATVLFAESYFGIHLHRILSGALLLYLAVWMAWTAGRSMAGLFQPPRHRARLVPAGVVWLLHPFLDAAARQARFEKPPTHAPMIALTEMWFIPTLRRLLFPLALATALLIWAGTAFHEIPQGSVGLRSRFGRLDAQPLTPGLHLTLPWPLAEVTPLAADKLQSIVLGAAGDTGRPILWDREHYVGEENQLVGNGEDFLTISVPIFFHLRSPLDFYKHTVDAERTVRDLAQRELLSLTLHRTTFAIMTEDRGLLEKELRARLQAALDRREAGIEIDLVCLRDIHPPVQVAPAFQEVVGAVEEKEEIIHAAEAYRADNFPKAKSSAEIVRMQSDTAEAVRLAEVGGQVASFEALHASYADAPEVFRIRQGYEAFDAALRGVRKVVMDDRLRGATPTVVDARKALNPDFNPLPTPETPSLIPSLGAKTSDFERSIDNYLHMGQGALPAVAPLPPDPDNLLK